MVLALALGQDLENPLGADGTALHQWFFHTRTFQQMVGHNGGATGAGCKRAEDERAFLTAGARGLTARSAAAKGFPDEETPAFHNHPDRDPPHASFTKTSPFLPMMV
jgi:hypothetical protein